MKTVYVIMYADEIFEPVFYIDEVKVSERVERLNNFNPLDKYWYKSLSKKEVI